jgi:serine/threonine protein kinase
LVEQQERLLRRNFDIILDGKYGVIDKISQGGFGKVYSAINLVTKEQVVVKVNSSKQVNDEEFKMAKLFSGIKGVPIVYEEGVYEN